MASYEKINWKTTTPINTTNLDHMDQGILDAMNNIPEGATKFDVEEEQTDFNVGLLEDIDGKTLYAKSKTDYVTDADGNTVTAKFATVDSSIETLNAFKTDTETALGDVVHYEETEETSSSVVVQADIATKDSTGTNIASQFSEIKTDISNYRTWSLIATLDSLSQTFSLSGYNEYLVVFKTTSTIVATAIIPNSITNQGITLKYVTDSGNTVTMIKVGDTWSLSDTNFYAVVFAR